jgi:hypothetical protein
MSELERRDPTWVDAILDWKWTWLIARTAMVGLFLVSGLLKSFDFAGAVAEQEAVGLHRQRYISHTVRCVKCNVADLIGDVSRGPLARNVGGITRLG